MLISGLREEARVPGEDLYMHEKNSQDTRWERYLWEKDSDDHHTTKGEELQSKANLRVNFPPGLISLFVEGCKGENVINIVEVFNPGLRDKKTYALTCMCSRTNCNDTEQEWIMIKKERDCALL